MKQKKKCMTKMFHFYFLQTPTRLTFLKKKKKHEVSRTQQKKTGMSRGGCTAAGKFNWGHTNIIKSYRRLKSRNAFKIYIFREPDR